MKFFIYFLMLLAVVVIVYNFTLLNYGDILGRENTVSLIGILCAACVLVLLAILLTSKAIVKKEKE